jgi:hypothetical protein
MKTCSIGSVVLVVALATTAFGKEPAARKQAGSCELAGTSLALGGKTVCAPAASENLRRFGLAASLAELSGRGYADVVKELVGLVEQERGGKLPKHDAPGELKLEAAADRLAAVEVAARAGQVIQRVMLSNQGAQPARVLIDCGGAHLDFLLQPRQRVDTGDLLASAHSKVADILVAGSGAKLLAGTVQTIAAGGGINDCTLFEKTFDCNFCAGSQCRRSGGGDPASGECVPLKTDSCWGIWDEPISCTCK